MNCCNFGFGNIHLVHKLAEANLDFALNLYQIRKDADRGNILFSPLSISVALAMTWMGARNDTAEQIYKTLELGSLFEDGDEIHKAFGELVKTTRQGPGQSEASKSDESRCSLCFAHKIYLDETYQVTKDFADILFGSYASEVGSMRMRDNLERTRTDINDWVREATKNNITNLVPPNALTESTRIVVVNAVHFKGLWNIRFDPDKIKPGNFFKKKFEKPQPVMMMENRAALPFLVDYDFKCRVVELPYSGSSLKMLVFLPFDVDGLPSLERKFNPALINYLKKNMTKSRVTVIMPQIKINTSVSLRSSLQDMGIKDLFESNRADLSGMTGTKDLHYFDIVHNAFLDANDGGRIVHQKVSNDNTLTSNRRLQELNQLTFMADHPFIFLIYDKSTKMVIFLGRYVDPVNVGTHRGSSPPPKTHY